jgi:hypothetical protein
MPTQIPPSSQTPARQSFKRQDEDLAHTGSWTKIEINAGSEARIDLDDLFSSSRNNIRWSPENPDSGYLLDTAQAASNRQSSQRITANSNQSPSNSNFYCLTTTSLSSCQDGPSQLELWMQDFQRLEDLAHRLARS